MTEQKLAEIAQTLNTLNMLPYADGVACVEEIKRLRASLMLRTNELLALLQHIRAMQEDLRQLS